MKRLSALLSGLFLAGCSPAPAPAADGPAPVTTAYGFDVQLTMTGRAAERLKAIGERVTVNVVYHGEPKPGVVLAEEGMIGVVLGEERVEVTPDTRDVVVTGAGFNEKAMADVQGEPQIVLNVHTARKAHEDNLIWCGLYEGPVAMAREKPIAISCDLIEPDSEQ